jgi:3-phosphoshikimate 1-carboxyvinyltransferase
MPDVHVSCKGRLSGDIRVPGDKSIAHRGLMCGAMASGWTRIAGVPAGADVSATMRALNLCGVQTQRNGDAVIVHGAGPKAWNADNVVIDCANSGTTMRILMGLLASMDTNAMLTGDASLSRRPMERVAEPLRRMGARIELSESGTPPVRMRPAHRFQGIEYVLPTASAQVKTAILLAALRARGRTTLRGQIDSRDHTERMLPQFGARIDCNEGSISIEGGQRLRGVFLSVPGDPSSAAYWIAAALLVPGSAIEIANVCLNPTRTGFIEVLRRMGARIETSVIRRHPEPVGTVFGTADGLRATTVQPIEISSLIDELPLLAVLATQADGRTTVTGAAELRVKETDRIARVADFLRAMGATIDTTDDGFSIAGPQPLNGALIDPQGDHRIAMSSAVAALAARGQTTIRGAECVAVSYPAFFSTLQTVGGDVQ